MTAIDTSSSKDLYRCQACGALNDAAQNDWCLCTGGEVTLACGRCGRCFCQAPPTWKVDFWKYASATLIARRREERRIRATFVATTAQPMRPLILLIDDDSLVHSIVHRVLATAGFSGMLLHAHDGAAGLRVARQAKPDLVITDALLPVVDGRDISRTLKTDPATSHIAILIMTALYKGARYRNEALRDFRADDFIEKPVSAATLWNAITNLLGSRALRTAVAS